MTVITVMSDSDRQRVTDLDRNHNLSLSHVV